MAMKKTSANFSTADSDFYLVCKLREIDPQNCSYVFKRCKICNVNDRQLPFLKKDHVRELIPKNELGILAQFEYFLTQWQISKGYASFETKMHFIQTNESKPSVQSSNSQTDKPEELLTALDSAEDTNANTRKLNDIEELTLEKIIPEVLKKCKEVYEKHRVLSARERRLLTISIVDYFERKQIKFGMNVINDLAEQIVEHFPSEDKKSWCNRSGDGGRGRLYLRYRSLSYCKIPQLDNNSKRIAKQSNTSTSKVVSNSTSNGKPESQNDHESKCLQDLLKSYKCEDFLEIVDLWEDTMKYRCLQTKNLKNLQTIREFLNQWPSYKLETGHELLSMDFEYLYPQAMETFDTRWLVYKKNIEAFLKAELKDINCIKLLEKYQLQKASTNEDSSSCVLVYTIHAITKPLSHSKTVSGNVADSQHSMMRLVQHKLDIDLYADPYPCIFVVGNSLLEVEECYVAFMDLRYKLSYENCLAVCVQIFTVFKVEDPQASQGFWEFIRGYLFNIAKDKAKLNTVTENMVNYLETAASSI